MQNSRNESGHPSLISDLRGKSFSLLSVTMMLKVSFFWISFISLYLKKSEKEEKIKPKGSRIRSRGRNKHSRNQWNRKQQRKRISEIKIWLFEEVSKIDKPPIRLRKEHYLLTFIVSVEMTVHPIVPPLKIMSFVLRDFKISSFSFVFSSFALISWLCFSL